MSLPANENAPQSPRRSWALPTAVATGFTALLSTIAWAAYRPADSPLVLVVLTAVLVVIGSLALVLGYRGGNSQE